MNGVRQRLPVIDELKGVALILILIYHTAGALQAPNYLRGEVGVDIFLVLSGYTLALIPPDQSTAEFARRRLLRIFPAYWFALALFVLLDWFLRHVGHSWHTLVLHATALHAFGPEVDFWDINMSFWFLALLVPLYVIFWAARRRLTTPAAAMAVGLLLGVGSAWAYDAVGYHGHEEHLSVRIPSFFAGMAAALWQRSGAPKSGTNVWLGVGILAALYSYFTRGYVFSYTVGAALVIVAYVALRPRGWLAWLGVALSAIGTYSYEIYLLHQPLILDYNRLFWSWWNKGAAGTPGQIKLGVGLGLAVAALIGVPLHHVVGRCVRSIAGAGHPARGVRSL